MINKLLLLFVFAVYSALAPCGAWAEKLDPPTIEEILGETPEKQSKPQEKKKPEVYEVDKTAEELILKLQYNPSDINIAELLVRLETPDSRDRWLAAELLGESGRLEAAPYLIKRLGDRNLEVRRRSREALLSIARRNPSEFKIMARSALDAVEPAEKKIVEAIGLEANDKPLAATKIYNAVYHEDRERLWCAFLGLSYKDLSSLLVPALKEEISRINRLINEHIDSKQTTYPQSLLRDSYAITVLTNAVIRRLCLEFQENMPAKSGRIVEPQQAIAELASAAQKLEFFAKSIELSLTVRFKEFKLSDDNTDISERDEKALTRAEAARKLSQYKSDRVLKALIRSMNFDPHPFVRAHAALAISEFEALNTVAPLLASFKRETNIDVQRAIIYALSCCGDERAKRLTYNMAQVDRYRESALAAIGRRGDKDDVAFLISASKNPDFYKASDPVSGLSSSESEKVLLAISAALELAAQKRTGEEAAKIRQEAEKIKIAANNLLVHPANEKGVKIKKDITIPSSAAPGKNKKK